MGKITTISGAAKRLLEKNPELEGIVKDNPGQSYKALQPRITTRLCGQIGRQIGQFVRPNQLIWEIINQVNDEADDLDF